MVGTPTAGVFNSCNNSFTVNDLGGSACVKYKYDPQGNPNAVCQPFEINICFDFAQVTAPVIAGNQTVCPADNPVAFTVSTAASSSTGNTITYQWQKSTTSCTAGFSDISGAVSATYDPSNVSQTTYYRVMTTVSGAYGSCKDSSNCVTLTLGSNCPVCTKPNAGADMATCLPKTTANLVDAPAGTKWVADPSNATTATIDATTGVIAGMTATGTYSFILQNTGDATCADTMKIVVSPATAPIVLCNDGSTTYKLVVPSTYTNVIWYNMAGVQVGTGLTLIVTSNTLGLADGSESYYYVANDATGCDLGLCCPVNFITQTCCPTPNCGTVSVKKN